MESILLSSLFAYVLNILFCTVLGSIIAVTVQKKFVHRKLSSENEKNQLIVGEVRRFLRIYMPVIVVSVSTISTIIIDYPFSWKNSWWLFPATVFGMTIVRVLFSTIMIWRKRNEK